MAIFRLVKPEFGWATFTDLFTVSATAELPHFVTKAAEVSMSMDSTDGSVADARDPARCCPVAPTILYLVIATVGGVADLWSKSLIFQWRGMPGQRDVWWLIDGYFGIETALNLGAVFGVGQGRGRLFAALSVVAFIGILVWLFRFGAIRSWWLTVALGCVTGGIIGNLYDRLGLWWEDRFLDMGYPIDYRSGVRDWILWQVNDQWKWPNFNIADSLLVVGACMLVYHSFFLDVPTEPSDADRENTKADAT